MWCIYIYCVYIYIYICIFHEITHVEGTESFPSRMLFIGFLKLQNNHVDSCSIIHRPDPELDLESRNRLGDVLRSSLTPEANRTPVATVLWNKTCAAETVDPGPVNGYYQILYAGFS